MLEKPKRIADDEFQSAKWDEITRGRNFKPSDIPNIAMLCQWYAVAETCMNDITDEAGVHVAYTNDVGDIKALPQLASMKQASAEIRALNKQLGINDSGETQTLKPKITTLEVIQNRRKKKAKTA